MIECSTGQGKKSPTILAFLAFFIQIEHALFPMYLVIETVLTFQYNLFLTATSHVDYHKYCNGNYEAS